MDFENQNPSSGFGGVVDSVMHLFGEVMSRDAVCAIVEHCGGDLTQAIDIIVNMADEKAESEMAKMIPTTNEEINQPANNASTSSLPVVQNAQNTTNIPKSPPKTTYAGMSRAKGGFPKQTSKQPINTQISIWTLQTQQIVGYHNQGSRVLILMRGLPGSGKSFLAKELVQVMCPGIDYTRHILSTDDFFMHRGRYNYDRTMLPEAHFWNQNRVREAIGRGLSPIFVDNTNIEIWHMEPYVKAGVSNGYIIEVLEPNTPWAKKANQLTRKNTHDVSINTIRRLLDQYQNGVSGVYLIRSFGLSYPADKVPPVKRNLPPFSDPDTLQPEHQTSSPLNQVEESQVLSPQILLNTASTVMQSDTSILQLNILQKNKQEPASTSEPEGASNKALAECQAKVDSIETQATSILANVIIPECVSIEPKIDIPVQHQHETDTNNSLTTIISTDVDVLPNDDDDRDNVSLIKFKDWQTELDKIEKIEEEWENGDAWNDDSNATANPIVGNASAVTPKPPRKAEVNTIESDKFLPSASNYNDWTQISMFMPAWNEYQPTNLLDSSDVKAETCTSSTSVELGDTDCKKKNYKILTSKARDINFYYMGPEEKKIPNERMLDKSSMTNDHDHIAIETVRCKFEERHFAAFRKLFKNVSKVELRDIFDKCVGDVNWAVDIVLDGMANNQLHTIDSGNISDPEDIDDEQCECLAAYNIIPNINTQTRAKIESIDATLSEVAPGPSTSKCKKEKVVSESSLQLKRQIEQNVVIPDSHYSDHCLKIRKVRRGEADGKGDSIREETEDSSIATPPNATEPVTESNFSTDDDDSETTCSEDLERIVNVDLGRIFVSELDNMFGRSEMTYPENIVTRVNMPVTLLNEINALWIESFMYQLDQESRQSEIMLRQDEEFARQLALKEEQLANAGQEPAVPDLKDIMDMELALSIYKKEITAEWRNNEPNDLAARMTREKLYNLFPDVQPEILSELLMAHNNNFQATVEVLLSSTGNGQILEEENGVNKFITKKELERHEKLIQEQKKALSEVEWPLLPKDIKVDMNTVQEYRARASQHLAQRNMYYQRAQSFFNRDMTQIATYYSDVAVLHKKKYDQANSLAAASLMQVHAANCTDNATIDLHYLHVPEARESLDLFIDTHIRKLRELQTKGGPGPRVHTLFFITGRGLHSPGGPRIKPAVKRRLRERGIAFTERNPGLLSSKVCGDDKLTYQVP